MNQETEDWVTKLPSLSEGLQPLLESLVDRMIAVTGASAGLILLHERRRLVPGAARNVDPDYLRRIELPTDTSEIQPFLEERVHYLPDLWVNAEPDAYVRRANLHAALFTPLWVHNRLVGAAVIGTEDVRPFSDYEVSRFETLASQAAVAIDNTRLYTELERRSHQMEVLMNTTGELASAADLATMHEALARGARSITGADACLILDRGRPQAAVLGADGSISTDAAQLSRVLSGDPGRVDDLRAYFEERGAPPGALPWGSALVHTLAWDSQVRALLLLLCTEIEGFDTGDEEMVNVLCSHASVAFHNSALLQQVRERGEIAEQRAHLLETLINSIADPVYIAAPPGVMVDVNQRGLDVLGVSEDEVMRPLQEYFDDIRPTHLDGKPMAVHELPTMRALRGETFDDVVMVYQYNAAPEKAPIILRFSGAPVRNTAGEIILAVVVGHDMTAEHKLTRAREELISVASHELKTPLTLVKANAQLLARAIQQLDDPRATQRYNALMLQVDRMQRLIELLLDISRLETGRLVMNPETLDLKELVESVAAEFTLATPGRTLELKLPEEPVIVEADRLRIEQVLTNLLSNAARYSAAAEKLLVGLSADASCATISVTDRGIGIPPEELDHIFHRFYQLGVTPGSMGLGLYISQGIVQAHGGRIWADSRVGEGSTFHFTLPRDASAPSGC